VAARLLDLEVFLFGLGQQRVKFLAQLSSAE